MEDKVELPVLYSFGTQENQLGFSCLEEAFLLLVANTIWQTYEWHLTFTVSCNFQFA